MTKIKGQKDPGSGKLVTKYHNYLHVKFKAVYFLDLDICLLLTSHFKCLSNVYISNLLQMFYKSFSNVKLVFLCK